MTREALREVLYLTDAAPWNEITGLASKWGCECGARAATERELVHAPDCNYARWVSIAALPASGAVARVQALVEALRDLRTWTLTIAMSAPDPTPEQGAKFKRVIARVGAAIGAFAGHANKGDGNG